MELYDLMSEAGLLFLSGGQRPEERICGAFNVVKSKVHGSLIVDRRGPTGNPCSYPAALQHWQQPRCSAAGRNQTAAPLLRCRAAAPLLSSRAAGPQVDFRPLPATL